MQLRSKALNASPKADDLARQPRLTVRTGPTWYDNHFTVMCLLMLVALVLSWATSIHSQSRTNEFLASTMERNRMFFTSAANGDKMNFLNPLEIPQGRARNLPSIRVENVTVESNVDGARSHYGGRGDKKHLGGFTEIDYHGISPTVWKNMVEVYGVHSVLDVGCGRGISTSWFALHGVDVLCVEGSHDAVERSLLSPSQVVEHDFSRGPWWPEDTYDAAWAVEFLEHVGINYQFNYVSAFRKAALLFVSSSRWDGWHHVEVHKDPWWIQKFTSYGFRYSQMLTDQVRGWAKGERDNEILTPTQGHHKHNASTYNAQHIWLTMKVFVNPLVASLPKHAHLFFEHGCVGRTTVSSGGQRQRVSRPCGSGSSPEAAIESTIPPTMRPVKLTASMDTEWELLLQENVNNKKFAREKIHDNQSTEDIGLDSVLNADQTAPEMTLVAPADVLDPNESEIVQRLRTRNFANLPVIPVIAWPYITHGIHTAEHEHLEQNGIIESKFLRLVRDFNTIDVNEVWVGDTGWGFGWNKWCNEFLSVLKDARANRTAAGFPTTWPVVIVDFTDHAGFQRCKQVETFMGRENVRYTTRSLGYKRHFVNETRWVRHGHRINTTLEDGTHYVHTPLVVRTDTIDSLNQVLEKENGMNLWDDIAGMDRPTDITHFWPLDLKGVNPIFSELRLRVSEVIHQFGRETKYKTFIGLKGNAVRTGRRAVKTEYIQGMLETKILVVSQRDRWEDHYRLMEALVSGACVFTDFMHGLPAGLQDGTSIVEFSSEQSLRTLLQFYLENPEKRIAVGRRGREIAMSRHRSWHRMEEVVFGEILSTCSSLNQPHCPYVVHATGK